MPKQRGPYKRYLFDSTIEVPDSTKNDHKRKKSTITSNENIHQMNQTLDDECVDSDENLQIHLENDMVIRDGSFIRQEEQTVNLNEEISNSDQLNNDEAINTHSDIFHDNLTKEDMAAAYLASFFSGKTTQKSLADYLHLSNMFSSTQLPTSFDGLISLIVDKKKLKFEKKWYCGVCLKSIEELATRFQRNCTTCNTR